MEYRILPTYDLAFKSILADQNHLEVTAGFINDFFGTTITAGDIRLVTPLNIGTYQGILTKPPAQVRQILLETRRDVTVKIPAANITIEMQLQKHPNFISRALFYLAQTFVSQYDGQVRASDDRYATLHPVWGMNILGHRKFDDAKPYRIFALRDEDTDNVLHPALFRFGFYELPKADAVADPEDYGAVRRQQWARFLTTGVLPDGAPAYLRRASSIMERINHNPKEAEVITVVEKYEADLGSAIAGVLAKKAVKKRRQDGRQDERVKLAHAMLSEGFDRDTVVRLTGLTPSQIANLGLRRAAQTD